MNLDFFNSVTSKKKVLVRGPVLTQSGYGVHARQVAKWLLKKPNVDVEFQALPWGDTPWIIDGSVDGGTIGKIMEKTVDPTGRKYDVSFQIQLPNEWDPNIANLNIGITAGVETDKCNPEWINCCNRMSMVIVPSNHTKNGLLATGEVKVPLNVIPESFSDAIVGSLETHVDRLDFSTPFNFLIFGQITGNNPENERKNIFYTVKWLCEVFKNDKDVGIVIKTNAGRNTCIDRKIVNQTFDALLREVRVGPSPKVHLIHGDMSDEEVSSLYRHPKIKALISLTRGEGYVLPILEAAASGLPVIATSWSGHVDFLSHGRYVEIDYDLKEIHPSRVDNKIFMKGSKWSYTKEDDFKKKVLKFRNGHSIPREWALNLQKKIQEKYCFSSIASLYDQVTEGIL
jgi:glycosyltransferase involved in cell wall biosynthesis